MWVTVFASQPSVSIETETTQRICSPSLPFLPTVFIASRRRSASVSFRRRRLGCAGGSSCLKASISRAASCLKSLAERLAGLELRRVDQDRALPRRPCSVARRSTSAVELARHERGLAVVELLVPDPRSSRRRASTPPCSGRRRSSPAAARRALPAHFGSGRSSVHSCGRDSAARPRASLGWSSLATLSSLLLDPLGQRRLDVVPQVQVDELLVLWHRRRRGCAGP